MVVLLSTKTTILMQVIMSIGDTRKTPDKNVLPSQVKAFGTHLYINDIKDIFNMSINFHA